MQQASLPAGWTARPARADDADQVADLLSARSAALGLASRTTRQDIENWWSSPRFALETDCLLLFDDEGTLAAEADVDDRGAPFVTFGCSALHPRAAALDPVWDVLHQWCVDRAASLALQAAPGLRVVIESRAHGVDRAKHAGLLRAEFTLARAQNLMGIGFSVPPRAARWPEGFALCSPDIERDMDALLDAYEETWRDHWGYVERPRDDIVRRYRRLIEQEGDLFDPTLWFVAKVGDTVAGLCLTSRHIDGDTSRGFVSGLGVRPAYRRRGLGLALLGHALGQLHARGCRSVELDMDSQSLTGALRLYERAGMSVLRRTLFFHKELRAGTDLATRSLTA